MRAAHRCSVGRHAGSAGLFALLAFVAAGDGGSDPPLVRPEAVRGHVEFLASDALNGRGSATRDELVAATYAASQLRQFGVEPMGDGGNYVQSIELVKRELARPPSVVISPPSGSELRFFHGREVVVHAMGGPRIEGPLQKLDSGADGKAVRHGAVVFLRRPGDTAPAARPTVAEAIERGAAAVLTVAGAQATARWESLGARVPPLPALLAALGEAAGSQPTVVTLGSEAARLVAALPEGSRVRVEGELKAMERGSTCNVLGRLQG